MGRRIPLWQAVLVIVVTVLNLCYCLGVLESLFGEFFACSYGDVHVALLASAVFAAVVAMINGYKWSFIEKGILSAIDRSMQATIILMLVGALIGAWILAGIVPAMVYYGLMILKPGIFLIAACLICCIVSLSTGSSWTINLILCAMTFGGVVESTGILGTIATSILKYVKGTGLLVTLTIFTAIFVNIVTGDQYLAIILPGSMYKEAFEDARLKPKNLSRCLEDSGTITSNLVPWNTCGAYMQSVFGIGQWGVGGYAPYAILCWLCPLISIFYGFTGISMEKMTEEEYQLVLKRREEEKLAAAVAMEA